MIKICILDWIRAIAAISVVLYHYTTRYNESIGHLLEYPINVTYGYMGVAVFFILSGFLLMLNIDGNTKVQMFIIN